MTQARDRYAIDRWAEGLFNIDADGQMVACLEPGTVVLNDAIDAAQQQGLRLPILLRFPQILQARAKTLQTSFETAIQKTGYEKDYTALYPIKVNQQASVVQTLAQVDGMGLEVGSKPELITALAMARPGTTIVCNGYKDRAYIRLALAGLKLGLDTHIVIEKSNEWDLIDQEATAMGITPQLGVRARLASLGAGKWQNTGGDRAKFGLSPKQLIALSETARASGKHHWLGLLHFHMGSQISNLRDIAKGTEEAGRLYVELIRMGVPIQALDIGGGLGVDYEGGATRSYCSMNYTLDQYAHTIVQTLKSVCTQAEIDTPVLCSESGRALTAHHAVLVTHVTATESPPPAPAPPSDTNTAVVSELHDLLNRADDMPPEECFQEAEHWVQEGKAGFVTGALNLTERAELEPLYTAILNKIVDRLDGDNDRHRQLRDRIRWLLSDKYFINLSIFQSLPDIWAIDQVFPIVPLARLNEAPDRRAVLEDLTCDSDGRIDHYVDRGTLTQTLAVHTVRPNEPYLLGIFMAGAYQETLGDIHNLFGDTDTVNVWFTDQGMTLEDPRHGDTAEALLDYVGYQSDALMAACQTKVADAHLDQDEADQLEALLLGGLKSYTYLENT